MTKDELELIDVLTKDMYENMDLLEQVNQCSDRTAILELMRRWYTFEDLHKMLEKAVKEKIKTAEYTLAQFTGTKTDKL